MSKESATALAILGLLLSVSGVLGQDKSQLQKAPRQFTPREPRGIYAVVLAFDHHPYTDAIENPAISGLFLYYD